MTEIKPKQFIENSKKTVAICALVTSGVPAPEAKRIINEAIYEGINNHLEKSLYREFIDKIIPKS